MDCPACGRALTEKKIGTIVVDVCRGGCGGIWFDQFELQQLDDNGEALGQALIDIEVDRTLKVDHEARRKCPRCVDVVMMRHFYSVKHQVVVDQCAGCAGFWLDAGELATIRTQFQSTAERERALQADFNREFQPQLDKLRAEDRAEAEKARLLLRHLRPSYYITGK